jgi:ABC-type Mn2+/Zn2+ transport system ATPase subunit
MPPAQMSTGLVPHYSIATVLFLSDMVGHTMRFDLQIPSADQAPLAAPVETGQHLFVLGANGTGKSALMQAMFIAHRQHARRISAHRQIWFENSSLNMTGQQRRQTESDFDRSDIKWQTRWKEFSAHMRPSVAIYDLMDAENVRAREIAERVDVNDIAAARRLSLSQAPIANINELLQLANLPIKLTVRENEELVASKNGCAPYPAAQLSDGERSALLIAANVLTAKSDTLFLIDEPERHLHRSIISPLLTHLFARRPDCAFVVSTHDISLPLDHSEASVLLLRSCSYLGEAANGWQADLLDSATEVEDQLKCDILGARRQILFVEGDRHRSLDTPLYALIFPNVSIVPKGNCREVERAVTGIRQADDLHWLDVFGLIDADGRNPDELVHLQEQRIYPLPAYSVEAIYYHPDIQLLVARRQIEVQGGDADEMVATARSDTLQAIAPHGDRLAKRISERRVRDAYLAEIPNMLDLDNPQPVEVSIDAPAILREEQARFGELLAAADVAALIRQYPIRETPALDAVARALSFPDRRRYEQAVLKLLSDEAEAADLARSWFGDLCDELNRAAENAADAGPDERVA